MHHIYKVIQNGRNISNVKRNYNKIKKKKNMEKTTLINISDNVSQYYNVDELL